MKRTRKIRHDEETRNKIKAAQLINRLYAGAMGEVDLTGPQVRAATALLDKVLPNLQAVEVSGEMEQTHYVIKDEPLTEDEWQDNYSVGAAEGASASTH